MEKSRDMFEYDELTIKATIILDKYNFKEDIEHCKQVDILDPYDIREFLETKYPGEISDALDNLSIYDFMDYLKTRYNVRWYELINYRMY